MKEKTQLEIEIEAFALTVAQESMEDLEDLREFCTELRAEMKKYADGRVSASSFKSSLDDFSVKMLDAFVTLSSVVDKILALKEVGEVVKTTKHTVEQSVVEKVLDFNTLQTSAKKDEQN